jgi:hypothetical protein
VYALFFILQTFELCSKKKRRKTKIVKIDSMWLKKNKSSKLPYKPVHGLYSIEPSLPPSASQILSDPCRLQVLQRVEVRGRQPRVVEALRGREPMFRVDDQQLLDQVDGLFGDGGERFLESEFKNQLRSTLKT